MLKFATALTLVSISFFPAFGQRDSVVVWQDITYLEGRIKSDFPEAFKQANLLLTEVKTMKCSACLGRALMMMGKFYWANGEYSEGLRLFNQSVSIASRLKDYDTWSKATDLIANTFYYQAYYDSAEFYFQKAYNIAKEVNDIQGMILILHNTSLMYHRKGDFQKTIEYIFKGERLRDEMPQSEHHIEAMGAMGSLMIDSMYYREVIENELRNVNHYKSSGEQVKLYHAYQNLGKAYRQLEDHKTAARYFVKAGYVMDQIGLVPEWDLAATDYRDAKMKDSCLFYHYMAKADRNRSTQPNIAYTLELLGDAYIYFNKPDSALFYYDSALSMNYRMNNRITFTGIHRSLVRTHTLLKNYREAENHLKIGLSLAKEVALIHERNLINEGKFLYETMKDYEKAFYYSELYKKYLERMSSQETAINLTRMQAEYKTAKKESELIRITQLNQLNEEKIQIRNLQIILAVSFLGLIGALGGLFYTKFKQKKKITEQLQQQNQIIEHQYSVVKRQNEEKEALLHEIHHRVKNNLQIISSLINLRSRNAEIETREILKDLNSRIHSLGLVHEMLYKSDNLGFVDLREYLTEQCQLTVASLEGENIELCMDLEPLRANIDSALAIGLISNELITNAIKYAFEGTQQVKKIYVSLHHQVGHWIFQIADNGSKLADGNQEFNKSFGLRFVEQLVRAKLNGEMKIEARNGLSIQMKLKVEALTDFSVKV